MIHEKHQIKKRLGVEYILNKILLCVLCIALMVSLASLGFTVYTVSRSRRSSLRTISRRSVESDSTVDIPILPENYRASGLLIMPHSNIAEPFEIWYAPSRQMSRIDYYYGKDQIYVLYVIMILNIPPKLP